MPWSDVAAKEETHTGTAPKRLGRYRLLRKIARGGMAEVFVGRSYGAHGFEKTVAIKRILARYSDDPQFVRMMVDEAKISVLLSHPNIAQVLELGEEQGRYFLVMEYVPGQSLSALVKRLRAAGERLGTLEACFILVEALQGLHAAHAQTDPWGRPAGIIHRDVSPQNLLLSYDGHVKVIDFGIARAVDRLEKTQVGTIKGKLRYLAPEMIDPARFSKHGDFDHRIDVFAAGIILFELVSGRTLFTGANELEVYEHITRGEIPDLSSEKLCDPALMHIIYRALERDPDRRYPTAEAFADELRAYLYRRDPAFTHKRLAAVLDRHFAEEKAQREELEMPDPALQDEPLELHLTRTTHTPSRRSLAPNEGGEAWAAEGSSALVSELSATSSQRGRMTSASQGTSVSRRTPRNRPTGDSLEQIPAALGEQRAPADAETRLGSVDELGPGPISETEGAESHILLAEDNDEIETSTSAPAAGAGMEPDPRAPSAVVVRTDAIDETPATTKRPQPPTAPRRGPLLAIAAAVVVGLALAVLIVLGLESGSDEVEVVAVTAGVTAGKVGDEAVPLLIAATPSGAEVELIGSDERAEAPALFMVPPGATVEVRVSAPGYEARRKRVVIRKGLGQERTSIDLEPLPVPLVVEVTPREATVTVDGAAYREGMDVTPGQALVVSASAPGFLPVEEQVTPRPGEPSRVTLTLAPEEAPKEAPRRPQASSRARPRPKTGTGTLTITSTPWWGRVTIDGKVLDETTPVTVKLRAGTHTVEVAHPPKSAVERFTVKIEPGEKLRRTVRFK